MPWHTRTTSLRPRFGKALVVFSELTSTYSALPFLRLNACRQSILLELATRVAFGSYALGPPARCTMAISEFYRGLRSLVGNQLLLMPAVAAIIRDQGGRILCQQQHDNLWGLPAGAIEPGESPAQAVVREVEEETGLAVHPRRIVAVLGGDSCRVEYANRDEVEYTVIVFECTIVGGSVIEQSDETKKVEYFNPNALPPFSFHYPTQVFASDVELPYF